jgi:lysophospholipase L1-like esterase
MNFKHFLLVITSVLIIWPQVCLAEGPIPLTPPDDARLWIGDPVPSFSWTDKFGSYSYYLEFDDSGDWATPIGGFELPGTEFDLAPYLTQREWDPLVFNLHWRVRGIYFGGVLGEPGPSFHFSKTTAEPPETWEPVHGAVIQPWSYPATFGWSPYPNGAKYFMQFGGTIEMVEPFGEFAWDQTFINLGHFISPEEWHYIYFGFFWRMSAQDSFGNKSPWGPAAGVYKLGYRRVVCYGDSITGGYGASNFETGFGGYPPILKDSLQEHDGLSSVTTKWYSGGKAEDGSFNIESDLTETLGGVIIVMFGTVDIIDPAGCENGDCKTLERLQEIVSVCDDNGVTPIICTVIPYNPAGGHPKVPDVTVIQAQLDEVNQDIRDWCETESIAMADLDQAMINNAPGGDLTQLYFDWAHPNDSGYWIMAEALDPVVSSAW